MNVQLDHTQAHALFLSVLDADVPPAKLRQFEQHLESCGGCRADWQQYARAVERVRAVQRARAPAGLATLVARRVRRRRVVGTRALHLAHVRHRLPVEAAIPVLLGAVFAALLVVLSA